MRTTRNAIIAKILSQSDVLPWLRRLKTYIERRIVERSGLYLFDSEHYLATNPDVSGYAPGPFLHFIRYGWREDRSPHLLFDVAYYRSRDRHFPVGINPLVHFLLLGTRRQISPTRWFSYETYVAANSDVASANIEPFRHFVTHGVQENRLSTTIFNAPGYAERYPDVRRSPYNSLYHYLRYGLAEGRVGRLAVGADPFATSTEAVESEVAVGIEEERRAALQAILAFEPALNDQAAVVDVVIPVYRDYHLTLSCIRHVLEMANKTPFEIVVIDDCSPEPELSEALRLIADRGLVTLVVHERNRGFVVSVNDGIRLHSERDVVLLNSDAEVYGDWLDRLRAAAYDAPNIATVCPLTNAGTICSYPIFDRDNLPPRDLSMGALDALARSVNTGCYVDAPTAVGFCMYIKRAALDAIGLFDEESFGTGYGEENDFCRRGRALGWRDVIAADIVVHHLGSASFLGEKGERVSNAMRVIAERYPDYHADVMDFVGRDPLQPFRRSLDRERLLALRGRKNMLIVSHARGGGTEQHVRERIARYEAQGWSVFRLFADPNMRRLARLVHAQAPVLPNLDSFDLRCGEQGEMLTMLATLGIERIEIHHLADLWIGAPQALYQLARDAGISYEVVVHDYFSICPRINLAHADGMYCGEPAPSGCAACLVRDGSDYGTPDVELWREHHGAFLEGASRRVVPDEDVAQRLTRYFALDFVIEPHESVPFTPYVPRRREPGAPLRIGAIGAISRIKGLLVLRACARLAQRRRMPVQFVVVGFTSNDAASRKAGLEITGPYVNNQVQAFIADAELDAVFLPSTWPETYSYTLSIALASGLPIIAFDIGAIARRLRASPLTPSLLLPLTSVAKPRTLLRAILRWFADVERQWASGAVAPSPRLGLRRDESDVAG